MIRYRKFALFACVAALLVTSAYPCFAQTSPSAQDLVAQLSDTNWRVRYNAFESLETNPEVWSTPEMAAVLLSLMAREDEVVITAITSPDGVRVADKYGEGYSEYHAEIFTSCIQYCNRQDQLNLMLQHARPGSPIRQGTFEMLGLLSARFPPDLRPRIDSAVLAAATDTSSLGIRETAFGALSGILRDPGMSPSRRARIHGVVLEATSDPNPRVRVWAIHRLAEVNDPRDLALLERLAADDTAFTLERGSRTFPVRDAARAAIAKISP